MSVCDGNRIKGIRMEMSDGYTKGWQQPGHHLKHLLNCWEKRWHVALTWMAPQEKESALPGPRGRASWRRRGGGGKSLGCPFRAAGKSGLQPGGWPSRSLSAPGGFCPELVSTAPDQAAQRSGPLLFCVSHAPWWPRCARALSDMWLTLEPWPRAWEWMLTLPPSSPPRPPAQSPPHPSSLCDPRGRLVP